MDTERQRLINEAARIVNNIEQLIIDMEYWSSCHPNEEPIDPDPDGKLMRIHQAYKKMLASEAERGNFPSVVPIKAHRRRYIPIQQ